MPSLRKPHVTSDHLRNEHDYKLFSINHVQTNDNRDSETKTEKKNKYLINLWFLWYVHDSLIQTFPDVSLLSDNQGHISSAKSSGENLN